MRFKDEFDVTAADREKPCKRLPTGAVPHPEVFASLNGDEHDLPEPDDDVRGAPARRARPRQLREHRHSRPQSLLVPSFDRSEIVGFVAGFGTTFAAIPDLVKMIKRRSSRGINPTMASIMAVFQIAWVYYGLLTVSRPVILWNVVGVATNSLTVWAFRSFSRSEREEAGGH